VADATTSPRKIVSPESLTTAAPSLDFDALEFARGGPESEVDVRMLVADAEGGLTSPPEPASRRLVPLPCQQKVAPQFPLLVALARDVVSPEEERRGWLGRPGTPG
jgi:hypothetical protein